jgi:hypothetical protein
MQDSIPFSIFEGSTNAVLVTDTEGKPRFANAVARGLLRPRLATANGLPCWRIARMRRLDGTPFCAPHCPLQQLAAGGVEFSQSEVLHQPNGGNPVRLELMSLAISPPRGGRCAMFHLLVPEIESSWLRTLRDAGPSAARHILRLPKMH